tara:strand:- start:21 stop:197 length:177 start_codon:yes stop_codon:yes gene_type:complete
MIIPPLILELGAPAVFWLVLRRNLPDGFKINLAGQQFTSFNQSSTFGITELPELKERQ